MLRRGLPAVLCLLTGVVAQWARWFVLANVAWPRAAENPTAVEASTAWLGRARPRRHNDFSSRWLVNGIVYIYIYIYIYITKL